MAPIFVFSGLAACAFVLFGWRSSVPDTVATAAAGCMALASPDCSQPDIACSSTGGSVCYALRRTAMLGFPDLRAREITMTRKTLDAGIAVARVTIHHDATLLGYVVPLSMSASSPVP